MQYDKTIWVNNVTELNAEHMNKIENAIAELASIVNDLNTRVTALENANTDNDEEE